LQASLGIPLLGQSLLAAEKRPAAKARSVILLWLWGGPSHLDTFDPKPTAPSTVRGPFATIQTRIPGIHFSELFPRLAARNDRFSLVRSNVNISNAHHIAGSIALCGSPGRGGDKDYQPNFGSIVQRLDKGRQDLPAFITVGPGHLNTAAGDIEAYGGGIWGPAYDPFPVRCSEIDNVELPSLKLLEGQTISRLSDRSRLQRELEGINRLQNQRRPRQWTIDLQRAFRLVASKEGRRAFDISSEDQQTRGRYGRTQFGQSCLLARRLVEAEVPYIQVNWSEYVENIYDNRTDFGWDTHWLNFENMADRHGPILDRSLSALLDDLAERGLLDSTLVVAMGEFGRTPSISAKGGRDHWERCYFSIWAGAGIQPGIVVGESDSQGNDPLSDPITPATVGTTILDQLGIHSEQRANLRVLPGGKLIEPLL
jgi:hypothetical protein